MRCFQRVTSRCHSLVPRTLTAVSQLSANKRRSCMEDLHARNLPLRQLRPPIGSTGLIASTGYPPELAIPRANCRAMTNSNGVLTKPAVDCGIESIDQIAIEPHKPGYCVLGSPNQRIELQAPAALAPSSSGSAVKHPSERRRPSAVIPAMVGSAICGALIHSRHALAPINRLSSKHPCRPCSDRCRLRLRACGPARAPWAAALLAIAQAEKALISSPLQKPLNATCCAASPKSSPEKSP